MGRLFYSSLITETNTFSRSATDYDTFSAHGIRYGSAALCDAEGTPEPGLAGLRAFAETRRLELVAGISASASPGGATPQADYERLRDDILGRLEAALPIEAVFLSLHGAMVATRCLDCEGDLLSRIRALVGPRVPVCAVLDPHAHLTEAMAKAATVLVFLREYPHVDGAARTQEALAVMGRVLDGGAPPVAAVADCRLIGFFPTQDMPMRGFVDRLSARAAAPGMVSLSFIHGFPWGDTPDTGARVLAYAETDAVLADEMARAVRDDIWAIKDEIDLGMISVDQAMVLARQPRSAPLVLADISDNPGGGAPSDSTFLLRAALDAGLEGVAIGLIHDPALVAACHRVGVGRVFNARIGGNGGVVSGEPVSLDVEVRGLACNAQMDVLGLARFPMGDTAWISAQGIDIVISSLRTQMYAPSGFSHLGLDPAERNVLVVKSSNHFRAAFSEIAGDIAVVETPGAMDFDFARLPYRRVKRPWFPLDPYPFGPTLDTGAPL